MATKKKNKKKTKTPAKKAAKSAPKPKARPKAKAAAPKKTPVWKITPEQQIIGAALLGKVLHYYSGIHVITLVLEAPLTAGDTIRIKGHTTDLTQKVDSIQVEHQMVQSAAIGEGVAIQIADKARVGDAVYKV